MRRIKAKLIGISYAVIALVNSPAVFGGSHLWEINEIFSNSTGTIQFIELKEPTGANFETGLNGHDLISVGTGNLYHISQNLTPPTGLKHLLFGTPAYAALPGAPTPDYMIPANFFVVNADTIDWEPTLNYDTFTFDPGELPIDGVNSIHMINYNLDTFTTGANSPTNYAGVTGSINAGPPVPAMSTWGLLIVGLGVVTAGTVLARKSARAVG